MKKLLRRPVAIALAALVCVAGAVVAWLTLYHPPQDPAMRFSFVAYGDCRKHHDIHGDLCKSMAMTQPRFTLNTGDLVEDASPPENWTTFRQITSELRSKAPYHAALGDHDHSDGGAGFRNEFGLTSYTYDRVEGDIHIFVMNSCGYFRDTTDTGEIAWLRRTAAPSKARHKFAVFHHPPFIHDPDRFEHSDRVRHIHDVLVELKFCAAFCGHSHLFYTTLRDGVRYVVTGGGGANRHKVPNPVTQPGDLHTTINHYVGCTVGEKGIRAQVVDRYGQPRPGFAFAVCEH